MDLKEFVIVEIPKRCGVHPAYGEVAWLIYCEERNGNEKFAQKNFKTVRDRAKLALPFNPVHKGEYKRCLDIIEIVLLTHDQKYHAGEHRDRITEIYDRNTFTGDEVKMMASEWWNG